MNIFGEQKERKYRLALMGGRLKAVRVSRNIGIKDAAKILGMTEEHLKGIESGKFEITNEQLRAANKFYNLPPNFISLGIYQNNEWQVWEKA